MHTVITERFIRQIKTGGSVPCVFGCSDGEQYYVKCMQNNRLHVINEFVGNGLLKCLGVPTPESSLVRIYSELLDGENIERNRPGGIGFGSKKVDGLSKNLEMGRLFSVDDFRKFTVSHDLIRDFIGILLFDIWVYNCDRSYNNPNVLIQEYPDQREYHLVAIDHAMIFDGLDYLSLTSQSTIKKIPTLEDTLVYHPVFDVIRNESGLFFDAIGEEIANKICHFDQDDLNNVLNDVPGSWGLTDDDKSAISLYVMSRKDLVPGFYNEIIKAWGEI